jgi:FkbM family methyltransferase
MSQTTDKSTEDRHFQHYTLKHYVVSWVSRTLFERHTYTVRHGLLNGLKRKGGLGWVPAVFARSIETAEIDFWRKFPLAGLTVYDVGSFEGLLALFFASRAKQVICYEPNTRNHNRLLENIELNGFTNVRVRKSGVGEVPQQIQLAWNPAMPGGASAEAITAVHLKDTVAGAQVETIPVTTLDKDAEENALPAPDLIKIDIEGWELQALKGATRLLRQFGPALYLEMHGETLAEKKRKVAEIVAFLEETGYRTIEHVETGQRVTAANCQIAIEGHLFCPRIAEAGK